MSRGLRTGAPSTAVASNGGETSGLIGIVVSGAGTTGDAQIAISGVANCLFDNAMQPLAKVPALPLLSKSLMTNQLRPLHIGIGFQALLVVLASAVNADAPSPNRALQSHKQPLQFRAASGDIVSFKPGSMMVASADRVLRMDLLGANAAPTTTESNAPASRKLGALRPFSEVRYPSAWDGVTLVYQAQPGSILKSTYYVGPGRAANPVTQIRLRYNRPVRLDAHGNLLISFPKGIMTDWAPSAWQELGGKRIPVKVVYKLLGEDVVGFDAQGYDHTRQLVIDPALNWSTFVGTGSMYGYGMAEDSSGNTYIAGTGTATWGSPLRAFSGTEDGYLAKLNSSGTLVWNTFLGGTGEGDIYYVTLDSSGNIYVAGDSGTTWGSPVRAYGSGFDGFVAKLTNAGSLTWNTFLGGGNSNWANCVTVDSSGNVYATGNSAATWGSPVRAYTGGYDAFVAKLSSTGSLVWNTFLGASAGDDYGVTVSVDSTGNVYATGNSAATWGSPVSTFVATQDAFAAKLNSSGSLIWNTFLGGGGATISADGGTIDSTGNIYITGRSDAGWGSPVRAYTSGTDGFAAQVSSTGTLMWNTFLGGAGSDDEAWGVITDGKGNIYVTGYSNAAWGSPWRPYSAGTDCWVTKLANSGTVTSIGFFGGSGADLCLSISVNLSGDIGLQGYSTATWGSPIAAFNGTQPAFVAKINDGPVLFFKRREQDP